MSRVKGVLFDLDGTLINSEWLGSEAYHYGILKVINHKLSESEKLYLLGKPFKALSALFPNLTAIEFDRIVNETLDYYRKHHHKIKEYNGIYNMIKNLHENGFILGIVTAKLKQNAEMELHNTGLLPFFDVILTKEDCLEFKPSPVPLLQAAEKMNVKPNQCLYIGDQPTDIQATHAANMISAAALWGEGKFDRLSLLNPMYLLKSPDQLIDLLLETRL